MSSLGEALSGAIAMKNELVAGRPVAAWVASNAVQQYAQDQLLNAGFKGTADEPATRAELHACLCECEKLCDNPPAQSEAVGKLGDGKLIDLIKTIITVLLPLLI